MTRPHVAPGGGPPGREHRTVTDAAVAMLARLLLAGAVAIATVLVTQLLTSTGAGVWFFAAASTNLMATVSMAGVPGVAVRRLASGRYDVRSVVRSSARTVAVATFVIAIGATAVLGLVMRSKFADVGGWRIPIGMAALTAARAGQRLLADLARGVLEMNFAAIASGGVSTAITAAVFAWLLVSDASPGIVTLLLIEAGVTVAVALVLLLALTPRVRAWTSTSVDGSFGFRATRWLVVQNLSTQIVIQGDVIVAGIVLAAAAVADLGVALRLVTLVGLPMQVINTVLTPTIARLLASDRRAELHVAIRRLVRLATAGLVVAGLVLVAAGRPLLEMLFGDEYRDAYALLLVLLVGQVCTTLTGPCAQVLIGSSNDTVVARNGIIGAVLIVVGCAVGGVAFGVVGVAVFSSIGSCAQNLLNWRSARSLTGVRTDPFSPGHQRPTAAA